MARSARNLARDAIQMFEAADREGRDLSVQERRDAELLLEKARAQKGVEDLMEGLEVGNVPWERGIDGTVGGKGVGDQFVASKEDRSIRDPAIRSEVCPRAGSRSRPRGRF